MAERLGIKPSTLRQWRNWHGCPGGVRINQARVVYKESDERLILAWRRDNLKPKGRPPGYSPKAKPEGT